MSTRKVTLTIPESLAERLDAYPGRLKLSTFLQEKLTEFLDAEEAKAVALLNERQSLSNRVHEMVMHGQHGAAYVAGRHKGAAWAAPKGAEEVKEAHTSLLLNPYPLELGRPDLLPKSLLEDDPRLKVYAETLLEPELTQGLTAGPGSLFMLPPDKKDEALAWLLGWSNGVYDVYSEIADYGWMTGRDDALSPATRRQRRSTSTKRKKT